MLTSATVTLTVHGSHEFTRFVLNLT